MLLHLVISLSVSLLSSHFSPSFLHALARFHMFGKFTDTLQLYGASDLAIPLVSRETGGGIVKAARLGQTLGRNHLETVLIGRSLLIRAIGRRLERIKILLRIFSVERRFRLS
jgi:hypothetical protein